MSVTKHKKYKCEKRMGYKIDKKINFDNHLDEICNKSSTEIKCTAKRYPLHELTKVAHVVQCVSFSYCPLVWMFHSRGKNDKIN